MGSPVLEAVLYGSRDALLDALHQGGNPNDAEDGQSALALACLQDRADLVVDLIAHGVDVNATDGHGTAALHTAASIGSIELSRLLLNAGANPSVPNDIEQTPLMVAARSGSQELTKMLLDAGANAAARDAAGRSALHWASTNGDFAAVVELLLAAGTNPADRTRDGKSALDYAVALKRDSIIAALAK